MSLNTHVESLAKKHAEIETSIEQEEIRPYPDAMRLMQLKREKLRLKEQIRRYTTRH